MLLGYTSVFPPIFCPNLPILKAWDDVKDVLLTVKEIAYGPLVRLGVQ